MSTYYVSGAAADGIPNCSREGVSHVCVRAGRMWRRRMMWTCMLPNITDGGRADRHNPPLQSVCLSKVAGRISFCRGLLHGRLGWPDVLQGSTCPSIKVQMIVVVTHSILSYFVGFAAAASNANRHALMPPGSVWQEE